MNYSNNLKARLTNNAMLLAKGGKVSGELSQGKSAFIFNDVEMNFFEASYKNIMDKSNWNHRLKKTHSHFSDGTCEMQSSNSSDALLMNIFCHPKILQWAGVKKVLGVEPAEICFGYNPTFENEMSSNKTEVDMKISNTLFEAKLTETSFTTKVIELVEKYSDFYKVFDKSKFDEKIKVENYQLIRNILAAYKENKEFVLLVDASRIDLIRAFTTTVNNVTDTNLRQKLRFITWQEIVYACGNDLREYITTKYF